MRFYEMMLFLLLFNLVLGVMQSQGIYTEYSVQQDTSFTEGVESEISELNITASTLESEDIITRTAAQIDLLFKGILFVVSTFAYATIGVPWMFLNMGMPSGIAIPLGVAVWFIYGIGLAQIFFGRSIKDME